jgi:serine/threonine-protein phosphatase PGAM5
MRRAMATHHLYLARHGEADALGELTERGRRQSALLGARLARVPVDAVWHSPLPRAAASVREIARHLPGVPVVEAVELIDNVPYVPAPTQVPRSWRGFFDGYDDEAAASGRAVADSLVARFAGQVDATASSDTHVVAVTHAYPIAWLVRHALDAPPNRWLGPDSGNAALTVIEYRSDLPPTLVVFNDMSHLPVEMRWTGFPDIVRP